METGTMVRMELAFDADTGGTFPMTWSQQEFWRKKIRAYSHDASRHFNLPLFIDLPDDITADQAMVAVALLRAHRRRGRSAAPRRVLFVADEAGGGSIRRLPQRFLGLGARPGRRGGAGPAWAARRSAAPRKPGGGRPPQSGRDPVLAQAA